MKGPRRRALRVFSVVRITGSLVVSVCAVAAFTHSEAAASEVAAPEAAASETAAGESATRHSLVQVILPSKAEFFRLLAAVPEADECGALPRGDAFEFAATEARIADLRAQGFDVRITIPDLAAFYRDRLGGDGVRGGGNFGQYHTYSEAIAAMDALVADHPTRIAPKVSLGNSLEGRPLWMYKISDNPLVDEDEPEVFFNAYIHAREAITFEVVHGIAAHLLENYATDARAEAIVDGREIYLVPVMNPDGVVHNETTDPAGGGLWRKNRRNSGGGAFGVDLNRNFGYQWGLDDLGSSPDPISETYRGTAAFSEPEIAAVRAFCNSRDLSISVFFHSYSDLHIHPWGFDDVKPPDYETFGELGRFCRAASGYDVGSGWELLYWTNGGANDWLWGASGEHTPSYSFTTEVGDDSHGFWPAEGDIPDLVAENLEGALDLCELADDPKRAHRPPHPLVDPVGIVGTSFTVNWGIPGTWADPSNPAETWRLVEGTGLTVGADDLESNPSARWWPDGWTWSTARSHSATHSYYSGNQSSTNQILLWRRGRVVQPGEQLRFWTWYRIESHLDYGYVELSTDQGRTFVTLPGTITTTNDPNGRNLGDAITGNSPGWVQATFDLNAFAGQAVWIRFRYNTDRFTTSEGWYIDDVSPAQLFATETTVASGLGLPNHSFSGHPAGTFWYMAEATDGEGQASLLSPPVSATVDAALAADDASGGPRAGQWGLQLLGGHPIHGAARLRWTLPGDLRPGSRVRLGVWDVAGRRVAELLRGGEDHPGRGRTVAATGEVVWDAHGLASGLYFARLDVDGRTDERRLVVLGR